MRSAFENSKEGKAESPAVLILRLLCENFRLFIYFFFLRIIQRVLSNFFFVL